MWLVVSEGYDGVYGHSEPMYEEKEARVRYKQGSKFRPSALYEIDAYTFTYRLVKSFRKNQRMSDYLTDTVVPLLDKDGPAAVARKARSVVDAGRMAALPPPGGRRRASSSDIPTHNNGEFSRTVSASSAASGTTVQKVSSGAPFFKSHPFSVVRKIAEMALNRLLKKWFVNVDASHFLNRDDEDEFSDNFVFRKGMEVDVRVARNFVYDAEKGKSVLHVTAVVPDEDPHQSSGGLPFSRSRSNSTFSEPGTTGTGNGSDIPGTGTDDGSLAPRKVSWTLGRVTRVHIRNPDGENPQIRYEIQLQGRPRHSSDPRDATDSLDQGDEPRGTGRGPSSQPPITLTEVPHAALRLRAVRFKPEALKELLASNGVDFPLSITAGSVGRIRVYVHIGFHCSTQHVLFCLVV